MSTYDWMEGALCAQTDPEIFFPTAGQPAAEAQEVCAACPVRMQCAAHSTRIDTTVSRQSGIWAGLAAQNRRRPRPGPQPLATESRNGKILALARAGLGAEEIAGRVGCTSRTVHRVLGRLREAA